MKLRSLCLAAVVGMIAVGCGDSKEAQEAPAATQEAVTQEAATQEAAQSPESTDSKDGAKSEAIEPAAQGSVSDIDMDKIATLRLHPWTLVSLNNNGTEINVPIDMEAVIEFKDKEFSGKTGCNSIFGSYEMGADSISFGEGAGMTRMMCPPEAMAVEDTLVKVLSGSTSFHFVGGALTLEKDGIVARFSYGRTL